MDEPYNLDTAFAELYAQYAAKNKATREIYDQIMKLEKEMEVISDPFDNKIEELQTIITYEVKRRSKTFSCPYGKASFKKAYERSSWDSKALAGYAAAHPEIEQFKKTTVVEATVSISMDIFSEKDGGKA